MQAISAEYLDFFPAQKLGGVSIRNAAQHGIGKLAPRDSKRYVVEIKEKA